ncbi:YigZ family protein [Megasphaera vaginalis (ex Srinivasan et al. 2021)]|uniref:YigZ family protein n=1 Tax=Megasphaera vaginalis (ex Srinivasan et al. 2021) TaxID=1111454 RepID=U7UEK8_9FIRM|nr:YigZ family protein [Megasphaera vaginalis (ex Srinivasan et al. 2021)]ERT57872.1 YigZ family protein [Megasphaera vaginalis (ex Srinivasan et al. 2021)]
MAILPLFTTPSGMAECEYVIKKSRFIAVLYEVVSEEEIAARLQSARKNYWDASHNCYAYCLGARAELQKASDDGEPSGTAGKPILEVLKAHSLTNALIIVTRYFGGTKLGTGGLIRAYGHSAALVVEAANIADHILCDVLTVKTTYSSVDSIERLATDCSAVITDRSFTDSVSFALFLPSDTTDSFLQKLSDTTNGSAVVEKGTPRILPQIRKK